MHEIYRQTDSEIDTDVQLGWKLSHDDYWCSCPGCCELSPSPSSRHRTARCRWCSVTTRCLKCWRGGARPTCRLSHRGYGSTLCSHSWTALSTATASNNNNKKR